MSQQNQVIIVQRGNSIPAGLREALQSKGYTTRVCLSNQEAEAFLVNDQENIVVVYCAPETDGPQTVGSLVEHKKLHPNPIIFIGKDADQFESFLNRHFILATTITLPCSSSDVVSAIEYVARFVQKLRKTPKKAEDSTGAENEAVHQLYRQFKTIPDIVFDQLVKQGLLARELGGAVYATTFRPDKLPNKTFLPTTEEAKKAIQEIGDLITDVKIARLYRTALLCDFIFKVIGLGGANLENARIAAFLYSSTFIVDSRDLYLNEYLTGDKESFRKEICSKVKDSALSLATDYNSPVIGRIVSSVGKFIGGEEIPTDAIEHLIASTICGADMIDRLVYQRGVFQPVAAYCVLSVLKKEPVSYLHPFVLGCLIKVLAEAVCSKASNIAIDKNMRAMNTMMQSADAISEMVLGAQENKVELSSLTPGMKLSRPINTFDGKELLNDQMRLDQDLIWRLWQLAAIRPLSGPVVVFTDS